MSNGVELIVADGKSTFPGEPNFFRVLTNTKNYNRPLTLAPSTLNNVMMLMTLGGKNPKIDSIPENAILNRFVTKTCLTTYTYLTTYEMNGSTMIESREKVISNIATEERNTHNMTPLIASDMTFFKTPNLRVGEFSTTYTYYNTIMDEDVPIVATSKHVVVNTITAADDYLKMIQPSPSAIPVYETNTYYSTVEFSKTINDEEITKVINTRDVITQVIVTESLPHGRMPMSMSHELIDSQESGELSPSADDEYDDTEVHNYIKKTNVIDVNPTRIVDKPNVAGNTMPLQLYATKTYLTTFTYFTTLLQNGVGSGGEISSTVVNSHTRVIENVVTESIPPSLVPNEILDRISKTIIDDAKSDLKTRITLKNGHKIEITAANILKPVDYATAQTEISSIETNDLDVAANDLSPSLALLQADESENAYIDIDSSEENVVIPQQQQHEHYQEPIRIPTLSPKPKPASGSLKIPSLLNSINIPSFSALGPVINAMAGILTSNFGAQAIQKNQHAVPQAQPLKSRPEYEALPQPLPLLSPESQDVILSQSESKNKIPLYIPIREPNNLSHHASMMGSGIPISPGEVITANSDVIVGRPAVIGPKLPSQINAPEEISGMEAPPPFLPLKTPQRPNSFVKDIKTNGNINHVLVKKGDDYIGPPPPKEIHSPLQNKPIPLNNYPRQPMPQNLQKIQPIIPPMMRPHSSHSSSEEMQHHQRPGNILIPKPTPTQETQINNHYIKINHQQQPQPHKPQILPIRNQEQHIKVPQNQPIRQNHQQHHFNHHKSHPRPIPVIEPAHNVMPQNVIEIQKIPEVYSTDLPIITLNNHHRHHFPSSSHDFIAHELPEILDRPTNGQPLLVNIQPSQVANVVIPHDSSSVLVYGGVHEAHKAGQYFNDPPPHANAEVGIKSVNLYADVASINGNNRNQQQQASHMHYDVKDNIIVASDNIVASPSNVNLLVSPLISQTASYNRPNEYNQNSVHFSPSNVINFHPGSSIAVGPNNPSKQQILLQQIEQQNAIDQQLKQKYIENQKRIEEQRRQELIRRQKIDEQKRREFEEQKRREYEEQRRREYEDQQRQKQHEMIKKQEAERQKIEQQQRQQEVENQKRLQYEHEMKLRQEYDQHKKQQEIRNKNKNQIVLPHRSPLRPQNPVAQNNGHSDSSGFIVLSSNYNSNPQSNQNSFIPMPPSYKPQGTVEAVPISGESEAQDSEGPEGQESIKHPKLPSGENINEFDDEMIKPIDEYDKFVYHKITAASTTTSEPITTTTRRTTQTSPITTRRSSTVPISTERINVPTTNRNGPIYIPKPYPNHQFENLPILVNDLQHRPPPTARPTTIKTFQRIPTIGPQYKPNIQGGNTISQSMKPPAPPKISRRPTHPFNIHRTTFKISMPIDPKPDDVSVVNNLQTEVPFNPIYTQNAVTESSMLTERQTSSTFRPRTTESSTAATAVKFSRIPNTTSTNEGTKVETTTSESDLNIGEVEPVKVFNFTEENAEVFDSKETINPHNHGFINPQQILEDKNKHEKDDIDLMPPSNKNDKPYHTIVRNPNLTTYKTSNVKLEVTSSELETMKPPAPPINPTTKAPTFVEIANMKPPQDENPRFKPQYVNIQRPTISLNRFTPSSPDPLTTTTKSKPTISTYKPPLRNRFPTLRPLKIEVTNEKVEEDKKVEVTSKYTESVIKATPTLSASQTEKIKINTTPLLTKVTKVSSSVRKEIHIPKSTEIKADERRKIVHNTTILTEQIITSTKWIQFTNTKTITLSKTKTETIHHSHGIPVVSTSVQTVYETITETETLLKPTVITSIHPTMTIIRETIIPTYPSTTEEIIEGFVSNEDLDEFIINDYDTKNGSIVHVSSNEVHSNNKKHPIENESIFVVVNDKKNHQQKINIDPSIIKHTTLYNHSTFTNEIEDVSRDEEDNNDGAGHILLGGILIASPPQLNKSQQGAAISGKCYPECNKVNNEYCHRVDGIMRCTCRPGFARMFPDRPCKPIYTYIMKIGLNRIGRDKLVFDSSLLNRTTSNYTKLQETTYNGVDRMLMQSDLRDIYHSIEIIGFNKTKENGITGKLFIQLSENTNEKKLRETVKKYLRMSNYNLGGTELYANPLVTDLETYDFDECAAEDKSHDCSEFSHCFNLLGTYTCSCLEGFADESENPIYPGRVCVKELVGCEKCHYHGTCLTQVNDQIICECFQWYTGEQCQFNLKLLLFGLVIAGVTLFTLLMICIIITCVKKKRVNQNSIAPAMNIIQRRISGSAHHSVGSNADRKAMIQDTSSEASEDHEPAPYFRKKSNDETQRKVSVEAVAPKKKKSVIHNPMGSFSKATSVDQRDRSLTVMIPRAKYHPGSKPGNMADVEGYKSKSSSSASVNQNQSKLINYLESSPSSAKAKTNVPCEKSNYQPQNPGALVSAGFKVSAAGGSSSPINTSTSSTNHSKNNRISKTTSHQNVNEIGSKYYAVHKISTVSEQPIMSSSRIEEKSQLSVVRKSYSHGNLMENMDDWLDNGNITELAMSEARSYDETTIQAPTKAIRNLYYKQLSHNDGNNTEDMNTMAERDMASTVLLPHTHLYKPTTDRGSDISGFDSL